MTLQKRMYATDIQSNQINNGSHANQEYFERRHVSIPTRNPPRRIIGSPKTGRFRKPSKSVDAATLMTILLFSVFIMISNVMHYKITRFDNETTSQTHFLRRPNTTMLFDTFSLPKFSTLGGKYDGCLLLDGWIVPHSFKDAVYVEKTAGIVNGTGSNLINRHRLEAYDYDEVSGLVAAFNNAFVFGAEPLVYDCHVVYRPGGAEAMSLDAFEHMLSAHTLNIDGSAQPQGNHGYTPKINIINGTAILIAQYWCDRYYHWMVECFPRIALVKDYLDAHPDARLLLHRASDNQVEIYKLIGLTPNRVIEYVGYEIYHVKHLLVPTATAEGRIIRRAGGVLNKHFRRAIQMHFHIPLQNPEWHSNLRSGSSPSIVVQRRDHGARSMTNADDLIKSLKKAYPNAIVEEFHANDTVWDTFRMHYGADLVVAPHGAGEANVLFMRPGATMLEIYMKTGMMGSQDWLNPCHNHTSNSVGVNHHYVRSRTGSHNTPMEVDIDVVLEKLLEIFPYNSTFNSSKLYHVGGHDDPNTKNDIMES